VGLLAATNGLARERKSRKQTGSNAEKKKKKGNHLMEEAGSKKPRRAGKLRLGTGGIGHESVRVSFSGGETAGKERVFKRDSKVPASSHGTQKKIGKVKKKKRGANWKNRLLNIRGYQHS